MTAKHSVSVAGVVVNAAGEILLIERRDTREWQIPGGVLELAENIQAGLVREVWEETGCHVEAEALTGVYKNMRLGVIALVFRCRLVGGGTTESEETARIAWMPLKDVLARLPEAWSIRVTDALAPGAQVAVRTHDGTNLIH